MTDTIRLAMPGDAARIAHIYAPAVTDSAISFELEPPDAAEVRRRIGYVSVHTPWIVCERDGIVLGYAYAGQFRVRPAYLWTVEVSAYVAPEAQGGGVARAMYTSLFAALTVQGYRNLIAGIALPNPASIRLHEAMGFVAAGVYHKVGYKLGAWRDVAWFERPLGTFDESPAPPRPLTEVRDSPPFLAALACGVPLIRLVGLDDDATGWRS
ncbi:MAG: N-acetyltransferase family protein [bacterium]